MSSNNLQAARAANDAAIRALFADASKGRTAIGEAGIIFADGFVQGLYGADAKAAASEVYAMRGADVASEGSLSAQVSKFANFALVAGMWNKSGLPIVREVFALVKGDYKSAVSLLVKVKGDYKGKSEKPTTEELTALAARKPAKVEPTVRDTANDAVDTLAKLLEETGSHPSVFAAWKSVSELAKTLGETGREKAERVKADEADAKILAKHAPAE